jgi:hypothetical protein
MEIEALSRELRWAFAVSPGGRSARTPVGPGFEPALSPTNDQSPSHHEPLTRPRHLCPRMAPSESWWGCKFLFDSCTLGLSGLADVPKLGTFSVDPCCRFHSREEGVRASM